MAERRSPAIIFVFITILIDVIGIGIIIPVVPQLIKQLTGGSLSEAAQYAGWLSFSYSVMLFIFSPIMGGLSDRFGRRPVILASLFGLGIDYIFLGFAPTITWLFVGRILAGITGASFTTATAYIADVSEPEKRAQNFGLVGAAFGLGFILGPTLGGLLADYGARVPFFASAGLALLNWLYGFFVLPESLSLENRRTFDWKRANPISSLINLKRYPIVLSLLWPLVCLYVAGYATQGTWTYYTMEKFGWSSKAVGLSLGFVGLMVAIVQGGLTRVILPKLGEKNSVFLGLSFNALGNLGFSLASAGWMMYAIMVPYAFGGLAGPAIQGIVSKQVPANAQGELQGTLTSILSVTAIFGPLLMTNLFSYFTSPAAPVHFAGAPFLAAAILAALSLILAWRALSKV